MARYICPSCGTSYNGKRCRKCLYQHFTEEIAHGGHVHEGEPLVIDAPVRKPVKRKDPFGCEPKTRKGLKLTPALILTVILLVNSTGRLIYSFSQRMGGSNHAVVHAQREPAAYVPEDAMQLAAGEDIRILADWKKNQYYVNGFDIYVLNDRAEDIAVTTREVVVNGCLLENTYFYCSAYEGAGSAGRSRFAISEEDLLYSGVQDIGTLSFRLEAYSLDTYETFFVSDTITLTTPLAGQDALYAPPQGLDIYESDGLLVRFVGHIPFRHEPEALSYGEFQFYIENQQDQATEVYTSEVQLNGEPVALSFWTQLPPQTCTVTSMYLYDLEDTDFQTPEDLRELSFTLVTATQDDSDVQIHTQQITIPLN